VGMPKHQNLWASSLGLSLLFRVLLHQRRHLQSCPCRRLPPLRFVPLRRLPGAGQLLASEGTSLRVRSLSAFRTLSGPYSARYLPALFHAGPAHGVHPSGSISTRRAVRPFGRRCPLEVGLSNQLPSRWLRLPRDPGVSEVSWAVFRGDGALSARPLFRALLPASVRFSEVGCLSLPGNRDPLGVFLLGGFSPFVGDPPGVHPLTSFTSGAHARPRAAPQSVRPTKGLAGLPRACLPFRGLSPCRHSPQFTKATTRGHPSEIDLCCQESASLL